MSDSPVIPRSWPSCIHDYVGIVSWQRKMMVHPAPDAALNCDSWQQLYGPGGVDRVEEHMDGREVEIPFSHTSPIEVYLGRKTAIRRTQRYGAQVGMRMRAVFTGYSIVDLRITAVYSQRLGNMSEEDARREGYQTLDTFKDAWIQTHPQQGWDPGQDVWVIEWKKPS